MEYIKQILKKSGIVGIAESLVFAVLGIIVILNPESTVKVVSYILGIGFILAGIYQIIIYFQEKGKKDLYNYNLIYGIMAIIIGIVIMVYSTTIGTIFRIVIGIWIIYSSAVRASSSIKLKALKNNLWIYTLVIAVIMFVCGMYVLLNEGTLVVTVGALMIVYAVMDIIENIIFVRNLDKLN